jgi:EAL domain-containing protein (putative c-di-GMP-specific phosphodiesterase class I)
VDDFGSGYSSLSYLKKLPADEIKIDRSLIFEIASQQSNHVIVKTTIEMCHKMGFSVVAEGVETTEVLTALTGLDCDLVQGYLMTPPLPLDKLFRWLESSDNPASQSFAS